MIGSTWDITPDRTGVITEAANFIGEGRKVVLVINDVPVGELSKNGPASSSLEKAKSSMDKSSQRRKQGI
jgi:hypothetical protein